MKKSALPVTNDNQKCCFKETDYALASDCAVFTHLKNRLVKAPVSDFVKNYINDLQVNETDPSNETEFALRLTTTVSNWDIGASWHHTTEDLPLFYKLSRQKHLNGRQFFRTGSCIRPAKRRRID